MSGVTLRIAINCHDQYCSQCQFLRLNAPTKAWECGLFLNQSGNNARLHCDDDGKLRRLRACQQCQEWEK